MEDNFEKINSDERIDRKYLETIADFCTFEIDYYCDFIDCEIIEFDLAAQNTGNIFCYKYVKDMDEYFLIEKPLAFTMKTSDYQIPKKVLDGIFSVGRDYFKYDTEIKKLIK